MRVADFWALEKIAFRRDTFEDGASLLLRFAVEENEQHIGNNATGRFTALFPMLAGNTAADAGLRFSVLDEATDTNNPNQRLIVVKALTEGAKTDRFSRIVGAETHGSRPALEDWRPATDEAAANYIRGCVTRLAQFAKGDDESGIAARAGLGPELRSLISCGLIDTVETVVDQVRGAGRQWTKALESLGHFLEYNVGDKDHELAGRVRNLITELQPKDLEARIRFLVTEMPWDFPIGEKLEREERHRRQVEAVGRLAVEIIEQPMTLKKVLPRVSRGQQQMAEVFGESIADSSPSSQDWLEPIISAVLEAPEGERNFDLLSGYIAGIARVHPDIVDNFKKKAAQSRDLASSLPLICRRLGISSSDIKLVTDALEGGLLPPSGLKQWVYGGVLTKVPAPSVALLFDTMLDHSAEAFAVAVGLMGMYAHDNFDKLDKLRPQVRKSAENIARWEQLRNTMTARHYDFEKIMEWVLEQGRRDHDARATALTLARALVDSTEWNGEGIIRPVIPLLLSGFPEIAWPIIGQACIADPRQACCLKNVLGDRFSSDREKDPTILSLPEDTLFAWCHAHPDSAPAFAAEIVPVLTTYRVDATVRSLHPVMIRLLNEFGEREGVLEGVARNINPSSWRGSLTTHYELYLKPLGTLTKHPKRQVCRWATTMLRKLDAQIEKARNEDEEQKAQWEV